jgi:hypothetical protein
MKRNSTIAVAILLASSALAADALAQSAPSKAAEAQRLQKLKAQRDAAIAAAKARQNTINRPTTTTTPTVAPTTPPAATIARPTTTTAPTTATTTAPVTTTRTTPTATATATATTPATPTAAASTKPPATSGFAIASGAAATPAPPAVVGLDLEELKKTRAERRKADVAQLQARWGNDLLRDARAADELKQHAQRTAFLQRIRALASKANDAKTVQAVDVLITKEDARDADAMNALRSGAPPTAVAGATK